MKTSWFTIALVFLFIQSDMGVALAQETAQMPLAFDEARVLAHDATFSFSRVEGQAVLKVSTGHEQQWAGVTLLPSGECWDLSAFENIKVHLRNPGPNAIRVSYRIDNPGSDGKKNCIAGSVNLESGKAYTHTIDIMRKPPRVAGVTLFGMRGYPIDMDINGTIDPANVNQLVFFLENPAEDNVFEVSQIRASDSHTLKPDDLVGKPFLPFIDTFGQYIHRDWPGKLHAESELANRLQDEARDLSLHPGPSSWNKFGGWKEGPRLDATGFFRVQKYQGKWTLVDPEGCLFFSLGMNVVDNGDRTPIEGRATWFSDFPGARPEFKKFFDSGNSEWGHYGGRRVETFSFLNANLQRKYGLDWENVFVDVTHRRLRSWGLNTIGNWSDMETQQAQRTAYATGIWLIAPQIAGDESHWVKFFDVFAPQFAQEVKTQTAYIAATTANDPWCIGYFVDNELWWKGKSTLAIGVLASPEDQPAKQVMIEELKARYTTIEALNRVWKTEHASWEALGKSRTPPRVRNARADLEAFTTRLAETYFKTVHDALREVAPHHLYLGCRFASCNPIAAAVAAKYCDVVSFNIYDRSVLQFDNPAKVDVPLIVGEFQFGAMDRGMFHPGLVSTANQEERARSYMEFVRSVIRRPDFVGCHWFKHYDEPVTGRYLDDENYQTGFVDVTDTPYPETIAAAREIGSIMYQERFGK